MEFVIDWLAGKQANSRSSGPAPACYTNRSCGSWVGNMGLALISIVFVIGVGNIQYTHYKLSVLYYSVQLPGASLASVEVLLTSFKNWLQTENRRKQKKTHSGVYRVAPATRN